MKNFITQPPKPDIEATIKKLETIEANLFSAKPEYDFIELDEAANNFWEFGMAEKEKKVWFLVFIERLIIRVGRVMMAGYEDWLD